MSESSSSESSSSSFVRCSSRYLLDRSLTNTWTGRVRNPETNKWTDLNSQYWRWKHMNNMANSKNGPICDHEVPPQPDPLDYDDFS